MPRCKPVGDSFFNNQDDLEKLHALDKSGVYNVIGVRIQCASMKHALQHINAYNLLTFAGLEIWLR